MMWSHAKNCDSSRFPDPRILLLLGVRVLGGQRVAALRCAIFMCLAMVEGRPSTSGEERASRRSTKGTQR